MVCIDTEQRLPRWLSGKESICQCRRHRFNHWVGKIPWRRKWQPTSAFLPGKFHGQKSLVGYSPRDCKKVGHDLATKQQHWYWAWPLSMKRYCGTRFSSSMFSCPHVGVLIPSSLHHLSPFFLSPFGIPKGFLYYIPNKRGKILRSGLGHKDYLLPQRPLGLSLCSNSTLTERNMVLREMMFVQLISRKNLWSRAKGRQASKSRKKVFLLFVATKVYWVELMCLPRTWILRKQSLLSTLDCVLPESDPEVRCKGKQFTWEAMLTSKGRELGSERGQRRKPTQKS